MSAAVLPTEQFLKQERERVLAKLLDLRKILQSKIDPDEEDGAFELEEYEQASILIRELERQLKSLDYTLEQTRQGKYGICERCGNPIDPARLEAVPETALCLQCKLISERQARSGAGGKRW